MQVFSDETLLPSWLAPWVGDFEVTIEHLSYAGNDLRSLDASVRIEEGVIDVRNGGLQLGAGQIDFTLKHDIVDGNTAVSASGTDLNAADVASWSSAVEHALFDFSFEIVGKGKSAHAIMSSIDGQLTIDGGRGVLAGAGIDRAGVNLFSLLISEINPFRTRRKPAQLRCFQVKADITDGVVASERMIGMQTDQVIVHCGGRLDFSDESAQISCRPEAATQSKLAVPLPVDTILVNGPFADLKLQVEKNGLLLQGASLGAGIGVTGIRLSKLDEVIMRRSPGERPCAIELR